MYSVVNILMMVKTYDQLWYIVVITNSMEVLYVDINYDFLITAIYHDNLYNSFLNTTAQT